jgi:phosphoribosyl 1,2-cyclic phosphodiesterase
VRFASLGSGSKGNSTLVASADSLLMIDCGFSAKQVLLRMERLGADPRQLDGILVTHEHSDHSSGVAVLSRKYQIPVYMTHGTAGTGRVENCFYQHCFNSGDEFDLGDIRIQSISVPHDAREPCQFILTGNKHCLGILTDLGSITPHVIDSYRECDALLLEFNHDVSMLADGPYPESLKQRVGGDWGHLSNEQSVAFLHAIEAQNLRHLAVAHISEKNNCRRSAEQALAAVFEPGDSRVVWAEQATGFGWLDLS